MDLFSRYNTLIRIVKQALADLQGALKGDIIMSLEIEETLASVTSRTVPRSWLKAGFLSQTSLEGYIDRLKRRVDFYSKWLEEGLEGLGSSFWLPGFFQVILASEWLILVILSSYWSAPLLHLGPQTKLCPGQLLLSG